MSKVTKVLRAVDKRCPFLSEFLGAIFTFTAVVLSLAAAAAIVKWAMGFV
jgi:hypothetical protein